MPNIALVDNFECHDWGCKRVATQFYHHYATKNTTRTLLERFRLGLVCNIHGGAIKRKLSGPRASWYSNDSIEPIRDLGQEWDAAKVEYLEGRREDFAARKAAMLAKQQENDLTQEARFAEAWVERSTEPVATVNRGSERRGYGDKFVDGYIITQEGVRYGWSTGVDVTQEGKWPAVVETRNSNRLTPTQARALAQALILAANLADERDILNGPEVAE